MVKKQSQTKTNRLLDQNLNDLQKQINNLNDKWRRALADYQNLEKRTAQEKKDFVQFANAVLIGKFLSVLDNLERAECHLKDKGLSLAVAQFKEVLQKEGVAEIQALGKNFDPETMDCLETVKGKENLVVKVVQKGYLFNNKVLRPAKVKVGRGG